MSDPLIRTEAFLGIGATVCFRTEVRPSVTAEWVLWQESLIPCIDRDHAERVILAYNGPVPLPIFQYSESLEDK